MTKPEDLFVWLPDDKYNHLLFTLRSQLNALWNNCRVYGMDIYIDGNIESTIKLCEDFGMALRGLDRPWAKLDKPRPKITE